MSPETVLSFASVVKPETSALALDDAELQRDVARDERR